MRAQDAKREKPEDRPPWFKPRTRAFPDGAIGHANENRMQRGMAKVARPGVRARTRYAEARRKAAEPAAAAAAKRDTEPAPE